MSDYRHRRLHSFKTVSARDKELSQTQRRRSAAISLASFSSKKGHDRALQEFKKRKEAKFQKNAVLLREYHRVMKQEGYDAGKGASRKRNRDDIDSDGVEDGERGVAMNAYEQSIDKNRACQDLSQVSGDNPKKRHKSDPLYHARKEAARRKAEKLNLISQKEQQKQMEEKKQRNRKIRAKKIMQRTKKGQPLMKNVIDNLLGKIKKGVDGC